MTIVFYFYLQLNSTFMQNSKRNHACTFCHAMQSEINSNRIIYCKNDVVQTNEEAITLYRCLFYDDPNGQTFKYIIQPIKKREKVKKKLFVDYITLLLCACVDLWCAGSLVRSSDVSPKKNKVFGFFSIS